MSEQLPKMYKASECDIGCYTYEQLGPRYDPEIDLPVNPHPIRVRIDNYHNLGGPQAILTTIMVGIMPYDPDIRIFEAELWCDGEYDPKKAFYMWKRTK